jgi:hypothetical protein
VGVLKKNIRDKAVRRFAQDDGFVGGLEIQLVGCRKHEKRRTSGAKALIGCTLYGPTKVVP